MLAAAIGGSLWIILYSVVVEPPAALMEAIGKLNERVSRLFGRVATA
jgi:lipopolysaccharide export system permease protein